MPEKGTISESLYIGKQSDDYPNLNNTSILFRSKLTQSENAENIFAKFLELRTCAKSLMYFDQVSRFVSTL